MVIDKIRKMSVKGVKLKSESYFSISPGFLELWRKNLRGGGFRPPPPGPDRVKVQCLKVFCFHSDKSAILFLNSIFRTTPEVSGKLYFVEIS